jgi:hypothetical protein
MGLVVDAQVVKGYFQESVLGAPNELTASAIPVFDPAFRGHVIYIDDRGTLQYEWRSAVEPEWFDIWFADLIRDGAISEYPAPADRNLRDQLGNLGFPATGRDIWYARLSCAISAWVGFCVLISEDLDFYEPREKGCSSKRRRQILYSEAGHVRKYFKKKRAVLVKSVERFVAEYPGFLAE